MELYRGVLKVREYFLFDPEDGVLQPRLQGFRLWRGQYRPIPAVEGRYQLMLRPERLRILDQNEPAGANILDGTVTNIVFQGDTLLLQVKLADGSAISVRGPSNEDAASKVPGVGSPIRLGLGTGDAIVLPAGGG